MRITAHEQSAQGCKAVLCQRDTAAAAQQKAKQMNWPTLTIPPINLWNAPKMENTDHRNDIRRTLNERSARYGNFTTHGDISQGLKKIMRNTRSWEKLGHDQKEALEMIQHKIARILNGDPEYKDSWVDIAGYSTLVANRLKD